MSLNTGLLSETPAGVCRRRTEYTRTIEPARALAAQTLKLERTRSDLVNQVCGLAPAEIDLLWKTAPPRMPIPLPGLHQARKLSPT